MLVDKVRKFYDKSYNLNCSETVLYAANEEYNMNLSKDAFKSMAGFGGGMGIEGVCGAASGALAVIGIMFTKNYAHESDKVKALSAEFMNKFEEKLSTTNCKTLKNKYRNDDIRCSKMIETAAEILDDIVKRNLN